MIDSAEERIRFLQIADAIENGQADTLPDDAFEPYVRQGLLARDGGGLQFTEEGRREYEAARSERQADG